VITHSGIRTQKREAPACLARHGFCVGDCMGIPPLRMLPVDLGLLLALIPGERISALKETPMKLSSCRIGVLAFLAVIASVCPSTASAEPGEIPARRVAVVVNLGDPSPLGATLAQREEQAREAYRAAGYELIVLSVTPDKDGRRIPPTRRELSRVLGDLQGVADLKLDLLGHGALYTDIATQDSRLAERFPSIPFSSEQASTLRPHHYAGSQASFVAISTELLEVHDPKDPAILENGIGVGDLKEMLSLVLRRNPRARVALHALNCYSGAMGRGLLEIPGVQVFSSAPEHQPADAYSQSSTEGPPSVKDLTDYMEKYYRFLKESASRGEPGDDWSIQWQIEEEMLADLEKLIQVNPSIRSMPRTTPEQLVAAWCRGEVSPVNKPQGASCSSSTLASSVLSALSGSAIRELSLAPWIEKREQLIRAYQESLKRTGCSDPNRRGHLISEDRALKELRVNALRSFIETQLKGRLAALNQEDGEILRTRRRASLETLLAKMRSDGAEARVQLEVIRELEKLQNDTISVDAVREKSRAMLQTIEGCIQDRPCSMPKVIGVLTSVSEWVGLGVNETRMHQTVSRCLTGVGDQSPDAKSMCFSESFQSDPLSTLLVLLSMGEGAERVCVDLENEIALYQSEERCFRRFESQADEESWNRWIGMGPSPARNSL
jgi:hypothetical protein